MPFGAHSGTHTAFPRIPAWKTGVSLGIDISLTMVPGSAIEKAVKTIAVFKGVYDRGSS